MTRRAPIVALALATAACAGGREDATGGDPPATTEEASSGASSSSDASTTVGAPTSSSGSEGTSEGVAPPPDCDAPATACGVLCVDLQNDAMNCGKCGISCIIPHSAAACVAGSCALGTCEPGWRDCDADINNGCEQQLADGQDCALVCKDGKPEVCNLFDDNCDGACDEGALAGCRQPVHRASSPTLGHFYTNDAAEAMSGDFTPEALNFFWMYTPAVPGAVPFYRCLRPNGKRFYTTSGTCEGAGNSEGILGHLGTESLCGAIPLFRMYNGANDAHFYTTSEAERDNAVAMFGFVFEGAVGFVWPGA